MRLSESRLNNGCRPGVVLKLTTEQDIEISIDHIVEMIAGEPSMASDNMAKLINAMGVLNKKYQLTSCDSVDDLNDNGKDFIRDMNYFISEKEAGR